MSLMTDAWEETEPEEEYEEEKWIKDAACVGFPTYWWYADSGDNRATAKAKEICLGCPVMLPCLIESLEDGEKFGIWGGAGNPSRRWLRKKWRLRRADDCWRDPTCECEFCEAVREHRARLAGEDVGPVVTNGPDAKHGKYITYNRGCRCPMCTQAKNDHMGGRQG